MIVGFRFVALTKKGNSEILREIKELNLNKKIAPKSPFKLKHVIKIESEYNALGFVAVNLVFRKLFLKMCQVARFDKDSSSLVSAKHEFVKDLICVEGEDYFFEMLEGDKYE